MGFRQKTGPVKSPLSRLSFFLFRRTCFPYTIRKENKVCIMRLATAIYQPRTILSRTRPRPAVRSSCSGLFMLIAQRSSPRWVFQLFLVQTSGALAKMLSSRKKDTNLSGLFFTLVVDQTSFHWRTVQKASWQLRSALFKIYLDLYINKKNI